MGPLAVRTNASLERIGRWVIILCNRLALAIKDCRLRLIYKIFTKGKKEGACFSLYIPIVPASYYLHIVSILAL